MWIAASKSYSDDLFQILSIRVPTRTVNDVLAEETELKISLLFWLVWKSLSTFPIRFGTENVPVVQMGL